MGITTNIIPLSPSLLSCSVACCRHSRVNCHGIPSSHYHRILAPSKHCKPQDGEKCQITAPAKNHVTVTVLAPWYRCWCGYYFTHNLSSQHDNDNHGLNVGTRTWSQSWYTVFTTTLRKLMHTVLLTTLYIVSFEPLQKSCSFRTSLACCFASCETLGLCKALGQLSIWVTNSNAPKKTDAL